MSATKKIISAAVIAAGFAFGTQAGAHEVVSGTTPVPALAPGASQEFVINCPGHQFVLSGGVENNDQLRGALGPLVVTASYPKSTRSWAVEVTNDSGRPLSTVEARLTLYALCGYHHHSH
ncbi:MAG: hypothetical protein N4A39_08175 [Roseicyclus sp.]|jgi:hypothetical protein|nr:hypothetical protein [Roseicyclus sp.]